MKPECIRDALELARGVILREYLRDVEALSAKVEGHLKKIGLVWE